MAADKVYAIVKDGAVFQYPVLPIHIANNGTPLELYTEVEFENIADAPEFFWKKETLKVIASPNMPVRVVASYELVPFTLQQLLDKLAVPNNTPFAGVPQPMAISDVPVELVNRVAQLATAYAQERMDVFVKARNYDSIATAVTYRDSKIAKFAAEGEKAFHLRDDTYSALYNYLGQVTTGQLPVPLTVAEIEAILPVLSWE